MNSWLCALNGNKKCIKKLKKIKNKLADEEIIEISKSIPVKLEKDFLNKNDIISAFKLGYWFEKFSQKLILKNHIYGILYL